MIGWKKVFVANKKGGIKFSNTGRSSCAVLKLEIPKDATIVGEVGGKFRASMANVLEAYECVVDKKKNEFVLSKRLSKKTVFVSIHDRNFKYKVGDHVVPANGFDESSVQCAGGIHFFMNKRAAIDF